MGVFKVGDAVELKSGSTQMTIMDIYGEIAGVEFWDENNRKLKKRELPIAA